MRSSPARHTGPVKTASIRTGTSRTCSSFEGVVMARLRVDQIHRVLQQLVAGGDDTGSGLIAALIGEQLGELGGHIPRRRFQRARQYPAPAGAVRRAD